MRTPLIIVLALSMVACQTLPAQKTVTALPIRPEFVTPTDKLPELPFGLVILKPAQDNPASVNTWRNRAFCEQYLRTPPPGRSTSPDSKVRPIHTLWMVTGGPDQSFDCTQMLEHYDLARSADMGKIHFPAKSPNGDGPYLAMIGDEAAVFVDGSSFTDFSGLLASWNANVAATQRELAENRTGRGTGNAMSMALQIFLILLMIGSTPAGA
jgi:hypothetical protein